MPGGFVDTSAPNGTSGTWLLDPSTVLISDTETDSGYTTSPAFTINSGTVTISEAALFANLKNGNVTIDASTGPGPAGSGSISWSESNGDAFDISPATGNTISGSTLTLNAPVSIIFSNVTIQSTTGAGSLSLVLNQNLTGAGLVEIDNSTLSLNGGSFTANGNGYTSTSDANGDSTGINFYNSTVNAQGGAINITGYGGYSNSGNGITAGRRRLRRQ